MKAHPSHHKQLVALRRIEGQVRGIQKMVDEKRYCPEILTQLSSVGGALASVQDNILETHLQACVNDALKNGSNEERKQKVNEVVRLLKKFKKNT